MKDGRHQPIHTSKSVPETIVLCQIKHGNFTLCFLYNIAIWIFSLYWKFSLGKRTELAKKEKKEGKKKRGKKEAKTLIFFLSRMTWKSEESIFISSSVKSEF